MSSDPAWSWCDTGQPPSSNISAGWLPYFYDPEEFIRSGAYSSLGAFRLLHEAIAHRAGVVGVSFPLPVPPEVVTNAREVWEQYASALQDVVDAGVFVTHCGEVITETVVNTWPQGIPSAVRLMTKLRRVPASGLLEVDESLKVASSVRDGSVLGTWSVPRITNDCKRITGISLGAHSDNVILPDVAHCGTSVNIETHYNGQATFFVPEDGGSKVAIPAGSGGLVTMFTLEGLSEVPPNGYENTPPPPNCDYEYFLTDASGGPVRYQSVLMGFNEKTFQLDGEHLLDVTPWIQAENNVTMGEWAKDGGPGPTGNFSWDEVFISEFMVWSGEGSPPANLDQNFRPMVQLGEKPWRNPGGNEPVMFTLNGVVEAFRSGPFAPVYGTSIPSSRVDTRPRYADLGDTVRISFLALPGDTWTARLRYGSSSVVVGSGAQDGEMTELEVPITAAAIYYTVEVSDGTVTVKDTIVGALGRKTCAILSYEPSITTPEADDEQPGIIYDGASYVVSVLPLSGVAEELTLHGRFRLSEEGADEGMQVLMALSASNSVSSALMVSVIDGALTVQQYTVGGSVVHQAVSPSFAAAVTDTIFDVTVTREGSQMVVYLNGAVLATTGSAAWSQWPSYGYFTHGGIGGEPDSLFRGRQYRASLINRALDEEFVARMSAHGVDESDRWGNSETDGAIADIDFTVGAGHHFPDRSSMLAGADAFGGNVKHIIPITYGLRSVVKSFYYTEISNDPGETWLFDLPPNCSIVRVEFDVVDGFEEGDLSVGTAAQDSKFVNNANVTSAGITVHDSAFNRTLSGTSYTPVYLTLSEEFPTSGFVRVRIVWDIRGDVV